MTLAIGNGTHLLSVVHDDYACSPLEQLLLSYLEVKVLDTKDYFV